MENNQNRSKWRKVFDFMLNTSTNNESEEEAGDLVFDGNGDFSLDEDTTRQHQGHLLIAAKGDLRETPQAGTNITEFLSSEGLDIIDVQTEVELQLELDGQAVDKVIVDLSSSEGNVQIDAGWKKE